MKKTFLFLTLIFVNIACVFADQGWYTIDQYTVDITLNNNWSMYVIENIEANFFEPRHGIYREIPIHTNDRSFLIENFSAHTDPIAANSIKNEHYSLQIGSADETIFWSHLYTISYDVQNAITNIQNSWIHHQELYRNIVGHTRNTQIKNIKFSITLPKSHKFLSEDILALYGAVWEKNTRGIAMKQTSSTSLVWEIKNTILNPNEGLTLALNFWSGYFILPTNYEELSERIPTSNNFDDRLFGLFPMLFVIVVFSIIKIFTSKTSKNKKWYRSSKKAITIYYMPPKDIEIWEAFWFRYMQEDPKIFSALLYYRATKWWIKIENIHKKQLFGLIKTNTYHFTETWQKPVWTTAFDDVLFQIFFGVYDNTLDTITIDTTTHQKVTAIFSSIQDRFNKNNLAETRGFLWLAKKLTPEWEILLEKMRGYKEFLEKVDRPVIESELKNDPDYINKLLPWAVLFGLETKLLNRIEDLLQVSAENRYTSNNGMWLNVASFMIMNKLIQTHSVKVNSGNSGFGWGGFSWWGGGWWGGGSR